jgi:TolA-binding protein
MRPKGIIILIFLSICTLNAQNTVYQIDGDATYRKAKELYDMQKYNTAQKLFQEVYEKHKDDKSNLLTLSQYYIAQCAVNLFNADAEYLTYKFIGNNQESPLVNDAYFHLGGYFYATKKWKEAIETYDKADKSALTKEQQAELFFKKGYSYFMRKDNDKAKLAFYEIKDKKSKYTAPAVYYYSHIHYKEENYQTSLNGFLKITDDKTFGPIAPYYIVQIYYMQGKYEEIVDFVPGIIHNVTEKRLDEVSRITAESFFHLEQYDSCIAYYERYVSATTTPASEAIYQFGYACYKTEKFDQAIINFAKISPLESAIGQNASYYLASCYLKKNDKENARKAFASASRSDYDPAIKQDATFNYALLTLEIGGDPFNDAVVAFEDFIAEYPESKRIGEARRLLIQAYLGARNYKKALASIEKIENKNDELKEAYQRIAYNRGIELFNTLKFRDAAGMFRNALKYKGFNALREAQSYYWLGECQYREKAYNEAVKSYKAFKQSPASHTTSEYKTIDYNIAYAYYKSKKYTDATQYYRQFSSNTDNIKYKTDAYVRLGDCFFMQNQYYQAVDFYQRAINSEYESKDYAMMQKGICQGLAKKELDKISTLKQLTKAYPTSVYTDNAYYEIAQEYLKLQDSKQAIEALSTLESNFPQSELAAKAVVQLGLLHYNNDNSSQAIKYYKKAITNHQGTQEAKDAIFGLKNIYIDLGRIDEYSDFVDGLEGDVPRITVNEKDSLTFVAAEKLYMSANCKDAQPALAKYLNNFPRGEYSSNANFYLGDCYYQSREYNKAKIHFKNVIDQPKNRFTEQALLGNARIAVSLKEYESAITNYTKLSKISSKPGNIKEAKIEIMKAWYIQNNYTKSLDASKEVLALSGIDEQNKRLANFIKARSLQQNEREALALEIYKDLSAEVLSAQGAESKFRVAEILYNQKKYDAAEKTILEFSSKSTSHDYWIARSFILWADIFASRKNYFQAIETLQSILDYYENEKDGILDLAKEKKKEFEKQNQPESKEKEAVEVDIDE